MSINKITAAEIEQRSVERLANRPNNRAGFGQGGLTAAQLKEFFSALSKLSIDKVNEIIDAFGNGESESDLMSLLYTSLADTQDDERKLSLSKWVDQTEQKLVDVPGVMAEMESVIDGFTEASATAQSLGSDQQPSVTLHNEVGDDGTRTVRFEFSIPRGATGERGATGQGFQIVKSFSSVAEMNEAFRNGTDGVNIGEFVLIDMGETPHEPNSEHGDLYVKTSAGFERKGDLEGAPGIKGETGYTPEFKVVDGQCYVKRRADGEYELFGVDVVTLAENFSVGEAEAITRGGVAMGDGSVAGARGFGVTSFDPTNRQIKITLKSPATGVYASPAYASGDYFSILNGTHFAFCGTIDSVSVSGNTATITYTPTTSHGTNSSSEGRPWWEFDPKTFLYSVRAVFWVPAKPLVGYDLEYEGTEAFPNAVAMGGAIAAAMGAFCAGSGCIAGGNYAAIFGTENMGAYGNLMSGRENFSTGLHSALLGRKLVNHGDYNFLACISNEVHKGNFNALFGSTCIQRSGNGSIMGGSGNVLEGTYDAVFGNSHELIGDQNILGGSDVTAGNASADTKCHYGVIGGRWHKIAQKSTVRDVGVFGQSHEVNHTAVTVGGEGNTTSSDYQTIFGKNAKPNASDLFCLGYNGNRMTLGKDGTRDGVDTDAVTVSFLRKKLETDLLNGSW